MATQEVRPRTRCEQQLKGGIRVLFVATNDNASNSITKALAKIIFQKRRDSLLRPC